MVMGALANLSFGANEHTFLFDHSCSIVHQALQKEICKLGLNVVKDPRLLFFILPAVAP